MIILIIIILIIAYLIDNNNLKLSKIKPIIKKPNIWIYIEEKKNNSRKSFYDRASVKYINNLTKLCVNSIIEKNSNLFNINIITDDNILQFIPNFPWSDGRIDTSLKKNYIKYFLLYNKGGLWISPDTLCFKNLIPIYKKINQFEMILIKNMSNFDDRIIYCNKKSSKCYKLLNIVKSMIYKHYTGLKPEITNIFKNNIDENVYLFDNNINGYFDYNNKIINSQHLLSQNITIFKNPEDVHFINLNIDNLEKQFSNNWILNLDKKSLLESNMWITKLLRLSLGLKQKYFNTDYYKNILYKTSYNLDNNIIDTSKTISSAHSPFLIVTKESSRNT
uniref:Nucleotide-diphospho-sugar transferase domain-containing protein n=1 Tax=viral metagenome TaxID=1070528 RepID=A0A6C0IXW3_9ZZZZ